MQEGLEFTFRNLATDTRYKHLFENIVIPLSRRARVALPALKIKNSSRFEMYVITLPRWGNCHDLITVSTGALARLTPKEFEAFVAHEIAHVRQRDALVSSLVSDAFWVFSSFLPYFFYFVLLFTIFGEIEGVNSISIILYIFYLLVARIALFLLFLRYSQWREFRADALAIRLLDTPQELIKALEKIDGNTIQNFKAPDYSLLNKTTFSGEMVVPTLGGVRAVLRNIRERHISTHPPTKERIARLKKILQSS